MWLWGPQMCCSRRLGAEDFRKFPCGPAVGGQYIYIIYDNNYKMVPGMSQCTEAAAW